MARKKTISFDLTLEEKKVLDKLISQSGQSKINFFRERMLNQNVILDQIDSNVEKLSIDLDNSIEWNINQHLENIEDKTGAIVEKKLETIEDKIISSVVKNIKDLTGRR